MTSPSKSILPPFILRKREKTDTNPLSLELGAWVHGVYECELGWFVIARKVTKTILVDPTNLFESLSVNEYSTVVYMPFSSPIEDTVAGDEYFRIRVWDGMTSKFVLPRGVSTWGTLLGRDTTPRFFRCHGILFEPSELYQVDKKKGAYRMGKTVQRSVEIHSKSNPKVKYEVLVYTDGSLSCNCPSWKFKGGISHGCKHTREVSSK